MTVGVISVLYGNRSIPASLVDLADLPEIKVVVVDNSGDLAASGHHPAISILRPQRNLGYPAAVNRGLHALPQDLATLLLVNPDIEAERTALLDLVTATLGTMPRLVAPRGGEGRYGLLPAVSVSRTMLQYTLRRELPYLGGAAGFLSGALLALNRRALDSLATEGGLLREDLFFMDDVDLSSRARQLGVDVSEAPCRGRIHHVGGASMDHRPAVRIYFSRVSKVRYWRRVSPARGRLLAGFFAVESLVGLVTDSLRRPTGRAQQGGSVRDGFVATLSWLVRHDQAIDRRILGRP